MARHLRKHTPLGRLREGHLHWVLLLSVIGVIAFGGTFLCLMEHDASLESRFVKANIIMPDNRSHTHLPWAAPPPRTLLRGMAISGRSHMGGVNGVNCLTFELARQPLLNADKDWPINLRPVDDYKGLRLPCSCVQDEPPEAVSRSRPLSAIDPAKLHKGPNLMMERADPPTGRYRQVGRLANGWTEFSDEVCGLAYLEPVKPVTGRKRSGRPAP